MSVPWKFPAILYSIKGVITVYVSVFGPLVAKWRNKLGWFFKQNTFGSSYIFSPNINPKYSVLRKLQSVRELLWFLYSAPYRAENSIKLKIATTYHVHLLDKRTTKTSWNSVQYWRRHHSFCIWAFGPLMAKWRNRFGQFFHVTHQWPIVQLPTEYQIKIFWRSQVTERKGTFFRFYKVPPTGLKN